MRSCKICTSEHRTDIESLIVSNESYRSISEIINERFGEEISAAAVQRHVANGHMKGPLEAAKKEREAKGIPLFERLKDLQAKVSSLLARAEKEKKWGTLTGFIREARELLKLESQLTGEIETTVVEKQAVGVIFLPQQMTPAEWVREHGGELAPSDYDVEPQNPVHKFNRNGI